MQYKKVLSSDDAEEFSNLLNKGCWIVLFYADWCGHCNAMKPEWNKAVEQLASSKHINVADVNSNVIEQVTPKPEIEGFPTIKMYNNGQVIAKFEDERSADKITAFANSNSITSTSNSASNGNNENTMVNVNADRLENLVKKVEILKGKNRKVHKSSSARKLKMKNSKKTNSKKPSSKKPSSKKPSSKKPSSKKPSNKKPSSKKARM